MKPASTFSSYPEKKQTLLVAVFLVVLYAVFSMCDNLKGIFIPVSQLPRQEPRKATLPASAAV